jgi:DegV family protein with EDD domain
MAIRIVTDSTCDLPPEIIARYGISVVPLYINVGDQEYLDGIDLTRQEFYARLPTFPVHPTTAVPSPQKFQVIYNLLADEGATSVLSIHISEALSAVVNVARLAAQEISSTLVTVLDSRQLSLGTGFLVEKAAKMAAEGHSVEEILSALGAQIKRSHVFAALDTLEFLRRSGRMNRFIANLGAFLHIKPILTMYDGKPGKEQVRTRQRATKRLGEMLREIGAFERIAILHSNALDRVSELRELVSSLSWVGELLVVDITPVIGAHIGPGAYGFAVVAAPD